MNIIEEIKATLCESYKQLYTDAIKQVKFCLTCAKNRRKSGRMDWAADWLESANEAYKRAISYKQSIECYSR